MAQGGDNLSRLHRVLDFSKVGGLGRSPQACAVGLVWCPRISRQNERRTTAGPRSTSLRAGFRLRLAEKRPNSAQGDIWIYDANFGDGRLAARTRTPLGCLALFQLFQRGGKLLLGPVVVFTAVAARNLSAAAMCGIEHKDEDKLKRGASAQEKVGELINSSYEAGPSLRSLQLKASRLLSLRRSTESARRAERTSAAKTSSTFGNKEGSDCIRSSKSFRAMKSTSEPGRAMAPRV